VDRIESAVRAALGDAVFSAAYEHGGTLDANAPNLS
jgi:hypothetical protein